MPSRIVTLKFGTLNVLKYTILGVLTFRRITKDVLGVIVSVADDIPILSRNEILDSVNLKI